VKRTTWEFAFEAKEVLAAAQAKFEYHEGRFDYWTDLYNQAVFNLKESGFVVDDSFGGSNASYREVHMGFDSTLERKMRDAKRKVEEHEAKRDEYGAFVQALSAHPPSYTLPLHYDDVVYFGLGAAVPEPVDA